MTLKSPLTFYYMTSTWKYMNYIIKIIFGWIKLEIFTNRKKHNANLQKRSTTRQKHNSNLGGEFWRPSTAPNPYLKDPMEILGCLFVFRHLKKVKWRIQDREIVILPKLLPKLQRLVQKGGRKCLFDLFLGNFSQPFCWKDTKIT